MNKKELMAMLNKLPDDAEIKINERGASYDWTPTNVYYNKNDNKIYVKNFTNKQCKKNAWPS